MRPTVKQYDMPPASVHQHAGPEAEAGKSHAKGLQEGMAGPLRGEDEAAGQAVERDLDLARG